MSDVNWGHEPQYLHNVRKIVTAGAGEVSTIAGGIIRKCYFIVIHCCRMCDCVILIIVVMCIL